MFYVDVYFLCVLISTVTIIVNDTLKTLRVPATKISILNLTNDRTRPPPAPLPTIVLPPLVPFDRWDCTMLGHTGELRV